MNSDETREDDVLQTAAEPSGFEAFNELTQYFIAEPKDQGKEYLEPKEGNHADEALAGKKRRRREEDDARSSKGREDTGSQASSTIGATRDGKAESSSMQNDVFLQSVDRLRHAVGEITSADFLLHSTQYQGMMKVREIHMMCLCQLKSQPLYSFSIPGRTSSHLANFRKFKNSDDGKQCYSNEANTGSS